MTSTGYFHCYTCDEDYPDSIQDKHLASHLVGAPAETAPTGFTWSDTVFWAASAAFGVIAGLIASPFIKL